MAGRVGVEKREGVDWEVKVMVMGGVMVREDKVERLGLRLAVKDALGREEVEGKAVDVVMGDCVGSPLVLAVPEESRVASPEAVAGMGVAVKEPLSPEVRVVDPDTRGVGVIFGVPVATPSLGVGVSREEGVVHWVGRVEGVSRELCDPPPCCSPPPPPPLLTLSEADTEGKCGVMEKAMVSVAAMEMVPVGNAEAEVVKEALDMVGLKVTARVPV